MKKSKKIKKNIFIILVLLSVFAFAVLLSGCDNKEEIGADINTKESLESIMENAKAAADEGAFIPFTFDYEVTNENCDNYLGLTPEQFDEYITESYTIVAAISSQAFDLALVKCKDYASAKEIKRLIASGFDSLKRICAMPDQAFVIESGRFVMLGGVSNDTAEVFQKAFSDQFETETGEVNKFYERGDEVEGGFGGLPLDLG